MNIQKKLLDQCSQSSNTELNAHIKLFINVFIILDTHKLNTATIWNKK